MSEYIITKIERQKKARNRVSIFLDGEFAFGVNDEVVFKYQLSKGEILDEARIEEIKTYDSILQSKIDAMRFLARRIRSEHEVKSKLAQKGYDHDIIEQVITQLRSLDLLNDLNFAKAFVHDKLLLKPAGRKSLFIDLRKKGIHERIANKVLDELLADNQEQETAKIIAEKYLMRLQKYDVRTQKRRLFSYLMRKGYKTEVIKTIVSDNILNDESNFDN